MNRGCIVVGTDTGVGKTHVTQLLVRGWRDLGDQVWIYKPVVCGDWEIDEAGNGTAEDGRRLLPLVGDEQDPATCCPHQWPEAASPHLAAQAAGDELLGTQITGELSKLQDSCLDHNRRLIVEGAGGVAVPLSTDDHTIMDLAAQSGLPLVVVTRPHLGTLNHTLLTIMALKQRRLPILGLVMNYHDRVRPSLATQTARSELERLGSIPVLAEIAYQDDSLPTARLLAQSVTRAEELCHAD